MEWGGDGDGEREPILLSLASITAQARTKSVPAAAAAAALGAGLQWIPPRLALPAGWCSRVGARDVTAGGRRSCCCGSRYGSEPRAEESICVSGETRKEIELGGGGGAGLYV